MRTPILAGLVVLATVAVPVPLLTQQAAGSAALTVVDDLTGEPLVGARVRLEGPELSALTNPEGRVTLTGIPPGRHTLEVSMFGYESRRAILIFRGGEAAEGRIELRQRVLEIGGVVATVERNRSAMLERRGFYERARTGMGKYFDRQDIERINPFDAADLFRQVSGVRVSYGSRGNRYLLGRRAATSLRIGDLQAGCAMRVYVDDMPWTGPIDDLNIQAIGGIEVYPGSAFVPIQYGGTNGGCGVVVIWTD